MVPSTGSPMDHSVTSPPMNRPRKSSKPAGEPKLEKQEQKLSGGGNKAMGFMTFMGRVRKASKTKSKEIGEDVRPDSDDFSTESNPSFARQRGLSNEEAHPITPQEFLLTKVEEVGKEELLVHHDEAPKYHAQVQRPPHWYRSLDEPDPETDTRGYYIIEGYSAEQYARDYTGLIGSHPNLDIDSDSDVTEKATNIAPPTPTALRRPEKQTRIAATTRKFRHNFEEPVDSLTPPKTLRKITSHETFITDKTTWTGIMRRANELEQTIIGERTTPTQKPFRPRPAQESAVQKKIRAFEQAQAQRGAAGKTDADIEMEAFKLAQERLNEIAEEGKKLRANRPGLSKATTFNVQATGTRRSSRDIETEAMRPRAVNRANTISPTKNDGKGLGILMGSGKAMF